MSEQSIVRLLKMLGENPSRPDLLETPKRYLSFLAEACTRKPTKFKTFESTYKDMVVEKELTFHSLCEHHIVPFFGKAVIAYIPNGRIVGLSKLPRVLDHFAAGLQTQERITTAVAEYLMNNDELKPLGVAVVLEAEHLCMRMRGVEKVGATTTTKCFLGAMTEKNNKTEFYNLVK